jgi:LacI family transcriptional regulator
VCLELGLSIPADIAFFGFDDFALASLIAPRLSAIQQPAHEIGCRAVEMLTLRLQQTDRLAATTVLPTKLIIRNSCGCPNSPVVDKRTHADAGQSGKLSSRASMEVPA